VSNLDVEIVDVTDRPEYEHLLIGCIFHRRKKVSIEDLRKERRERVKYLESAILQGLRMKILFWRGDYVGMVEYGPPGASGLPIVGDNIVVMNCIWVQRRARGRRFGKLLLDSMVKAEEQASGFATLALEDYWMMWMHRWMMEHLGFRSVRSVKLKHKTYHKERCFTAHLMWLPVDEDAPLPAWDESRLLCGVDFCSFHPLYWARYGCAKQGLREIYEKC